MPRRSSPTSARIPGYASLLGQLARFQMLRQVDFGAAVATADRALAIAEHLDRVDLVADALVTRGTGPDQHGAGTTKGIGCLETGLRLAERHGPARTEIRARTNMGGPLTDPRPAGGVRGLAGRAGARPALRPPPGRLDAHRQREHRRHGDR